MSIKLSEKAVAKIGSFYDGDPEIAGKPLRIGLSAGGCSGFSYVMGISAKGENDNTFPYEKFEVVVDREHMKLMGDLEVDYVESLTQSGFSFKAAKQTGCCGCGQSCSF